MSLFDIISGIGGGQGLQDAASKLGISQDDAQNMLGSVLQHAAEGGAAEGMIEAVASKAGVDPSMVQQFLPEVLPLLQGHAANAPDDHQEALGGLMGSVGGLLGGGSGDAGGFMGLADGFLGSRGEQAQPARDADQN